MYNMYGSLEYSWTASHMQEFYYWQKYISEIFWECILPHTKSIFYIKHSNGLLIVCFLFAYIIKNLRKRQILILCNKNYFYIKWTSLLRLNFFSVSFKYKVVFTLKETKGENILERSNITFKKGT